MKRARPPQLRAFFDDEMIVDLFAGGGGASCGIEAALGRPVDVAINHDKWAMMVHEINHPKTKHFVSNVWEVDPRIAAAGHRVGLLWASPDCTYHSRARGGKPLARKTGSKRRALASVVIRWAKTVRPRVIVLENVREFEDWGPLKEDGTPDKSKAGRSFRCWLGKLKAQGYRVEYKLLRACDYGTPTTRERLFLIARCDRQPIIWPEPSHGPGREKPHRAAAECIDFGDHGRSIFERKKPLADATLRRIAAGIQRYVLRGRPFIVPVKSWGGGGNGPRSVDEPMRTITTSKRGEFAVCTPFLAPVTHQGDERVHSVEQPVRTITCAKRGEIALLSPILVRTAHGEANAKDGRRRWGRGHQACAEPLGTVCASGTDFALCTPVLVQTGYGERPGQAPRALDIQQPLGTVVACGAKHALVVPVIVPQYGGEHGNPTAPRSVEKPAPTITTRDHTSIACAFLTEFYGTSMEGRAGKPLTEPMPTVTAGGGRGGGHAGLVYAFLVQYYSGGSQTSGLESPMPTVVCKDRIGLVTVTIDGIEYVITDVRFRMLKPEELAAAQGFRPEYSFAAARTKERIVELIGNSVAQQVAEAIVKANAMAPIGQLDLIEMSA